MGNLKFDIEEKAFIVRTIQQGTNIFEEFMFFYISWDTLWVYVNLSNILTLLPQMLPSRSYYILIIIFLRVIRKKLFLNSFFTFMMIIAIFYFVIL